MGLNNSVLSVGPNNFGTDIVTDRQMLSMQYGPYSVLQQEDDFLASPGTGHNARINSGRGVFASRSSVAIRGSYGVYADANPADLVTLPGVQSQPFIASIILFIADSQYGSISPLLPGAQYLVVSGSAGSSPVAPSDAAISAAYPQPGAWERIADVRINTADTGVIPASQFTDRRPPSILGQGAQIVILKNYSPFAGWPAGNSNYIDGMDGVLLRRGSDAWFSKPDNKSIQVLRDGWYEVMGTLGVDYPNGGAFTVTDIKFDNIPSGRAYPYGNDEVSMSISVNGYQTFNVKQKAFLHAGTQAHLNYYNNNQTNVRFAELYMRACLPGTPG